MDWYNHFQQELKRTNDFFTGKDLYIALCRAIAISGFSDTDDLRDLTMAFDEWYGIAKIEEEINDEQSTRSISKSAV